MKEVTRKRLMIFSGRSYPELGRQIAGHLGTGLGKVELKTFSNGELYVRYEESVRGSDAFVIQTCSEPINDHIMELLLMIDALERASAKRISAVIPYYGYSRQDKKTLAREPISARLVCDLLAAAGADRILTMDLHAGQIQGFFSGPVDHLTAVPLLASYISRQNFQDLVIVSPDAGRVKMANKYTDHLGVPMAILHKRRPGHNRAEVLHVIGEVEGKTAVLVDDMIDTAGTMAASAQALIDAGAAEVYACATHGIFSGPARERLDASPLKKVVVTNTLPIPEERLSEKVEILSIASIFANTIASVFKDESVSELFGGDNMP
ncbi:MAG: ribose-phosphate diphosphokinase [Actinobacteria bacterium]|nr:ribose-phosphate diphosphokinase [Actinomycetota bacterium]MDI6830669.1 ribose-phosphate diphosphokinase [Actinomycetota bacterium]